jgi:hypothetical protein
MKDRACVKFLCRQQWKTIFQIKALLVPEHRAGAGAGAVTAVDTLVKDPGQKIKILLHETHSRLSR